MFFSPRKNKTSPGSSRRVSRFRSNYFQQRIRTARSFKRNPKILPEARTNVSLAVFSRRGRILWTLIIVALFSLAGYALFADKFTIKNVSIEGETILPEETIKTWLAELGDTKTYKIIPSNNLFALRKTKLEELLKSKSQYFKKVVKLERDYPDSILLTIEERQPQFIWQKQEQYFLIDNEGFVLEQVPSGFLDATSTRKIYSNVIEEGTTNKLTTGEYYRQDTMPFLVSLVNNWQKNIGQGIKAVYVTSDSAVDLYILTVTGFTVYFDSRGDVTYQTEILGRILRQVASGGRMAELAYVDVRLPAIAYYCYLGEPCGAIETEGEGETD